MNLDRAEEILSESMVLTDHPLEPMVIRIVADLDSGKSQFFNSPVLRTQYLKEILKLYPEILSYFQITAQNTKLVDDVHLSEAEFNSFGERVWGLSDKSNEEFLRSYIDPTKAPLFRLHYSDGKLSFMAHHAFMDGRSGIQFLTFLLEQMYRQAKGESPLPRINLRHYEKSVSWSELWKKPARLISAARSLKQRVRRPPMLLGPKHALFGGLQHFFTRELSLSEGKAALAKVRIQQPGLSLNDFLVGCLHLVLGRELQKQKIEGTAFAGTNCISTMVPIDLRLRSESAPLISNLSTTPAISSTEAQRMNKFELLRTVSIQAKQLRSKESPAVIGAFELLELLGIFRSARKIKMRTGLPRRSEIDGENFWKFMDTAMITYVGKIRVPAELKPHVRRLTGFPPTIPPWGLSIIVFSHDSVLSFGVTANGTTIHPQKAEELIDMLFKEILSFN